MTIEIREFDVDDHECENGVLDAHSIVLHPHGVDHRVVNLPRIPLFCTLAGVDSNERT